MVKAMLRGRSQIRQAVGLAVKGEHLILFTRKHVVPRMERALAEIPAEIERGSSSIQSDCEKPQVATAPVTPRTAGNVGLPVVRQAKARPLSNLLTEVDR
jgi:hypothetical protein